MFGNRKCWPQNPETGSLVGRCPDTIKYHLPPTEGATDCGTRSGNPPEDQLPGGSLSASGPCVTRPPHQIEYPSGTLSIRCLSAEYATPPQRFVLALPKTIVHGHGASPWPSCPRHNSLEFYRPPLTHSHPPSLLPLFDSLRTMYSLQISSLRDAAKICLTTQCFVRSYEPMSLRNRLDPPSTKIHDSRRRNLI